MPSAWDPTSGAPIEGAGTIYNSSFAQSVGYFSPWAGANYPVFPASSPFYSFSAQTGYGGGDASLSSLSNAGYGGTGYSDTGIGLSGGPGIESFAPGIDSIPDSLIFNPNAVPTTPWISSFSGPVASAGYSTASSGSDYPLAFMFLPRMPKQSTEFDTPYAYFQYLKQDQFWRSPTEQFRGGPDTLNGVPAAEWPEYTLPPGIITPRDPRGGMFVPSEMAPIGPGRFPSLPPGSSAPSGQLYNSPRIPGYGPQQPFAPNSDEWFLENHPGPGYFDQ